MSDVHSKSLKALDDFLNDPVRVAEFKRRYELELMVQDHQFEKVEKYINSIPEEELEIKFEKFLKWEEKYEEFHYTHRHCHTNSMIFSNIVAYAEKNGIKSKSLNEDFLSSKFTYKGYTFKLYCGQGCFWRIMKKRKFLFQTT